jgi:hypothetical protein
MSKSPDAMLQTMIANLKEKTGRTLEEWVEVARAHGASKHGEIVKFLKGEHGMGHGYANLVAQRTLEAAAGGPAAGENLVAAQYAGPRAALRPIHDAVVAAARRLGADVEIAPKKTGVSLRRSRQFALIQPATNSRVDLGLKLDGVPVAGRLEKWPDTMCSHRVRLQSAGQVDQEVRGWLSQAYDQAK